MMMMYHANELHACRREDSQMYISSEEAETGLPAHNYQNACSQILDEVF